MNSKRKMRYLTIEEKREIALKGESVPICISSEEIITDYIVPMHRFIPSKRKHKKAKTIKL